MRYFSWVQLDERGFDLEPEPNRSAATVYEPIDRVTYTGILDADGNPIMKDDKRLVGFIRFEPSA